VKSDGERQRVLGKRREEEGGGLSKLFNDLAL